MGDGKMVKASEYYSRKISVQGEKAAECLKNVKDNHADEKEGKPDRTSNRIRSAGSENGSTKNRADNTEDKTDSTGGRQENTEDKAYGTGSRAGRTTDSTQDKKNSAENAADRPEKYEAVPDNSGTPQNKGNHNRKNQLNLKSPELKSVTGNLKKAAQRAETRSPDEIKLIAYRMMAVEAAALSELKAVSATRKMTQNTVRAARYTVTYFSKEERQKRKEYGEYYRKRKKEIKQAEKNIKEWEKEEVQEPAAILKDKYRQKQDKAKAEIEKMKSKNSKIRKSRIAERHTRSISIIKGRAWSDVRGAGKEVLKTPNRMAMMIAGDRDAEKLVTNSAAGILRTTSRAFAGIIKAYIAAVKNVMIAISPAFFAALMIVFMMYIMFFSDFDSYFDLGYSRDEITGTPPEINLNENITEHITTNREIMAAAAIESDNTVQVYFVRLDDETVNDIAVYMQEMAGANEIPTIMSDGWFVSEEAQDIIEDIAARTCYMLSDEEAAVYAEDDFEEYSGNMPVPVSEPETEPEGTGGSGVIGPGIGAGIGAGIGIIITPAEPEPQPEPETHRAVIGYHPVSEIR